jgi:hypothetical protein
MDNTDAKPLGLIETSASDFYPKQHRRLYIEEQLIRSCPTLISARRRDLLRRRRPRGLGRGGSRQISRECVRRPSSPNAEESMASTGVRGCRRGEGMTKAGCVCTQKRPKPVGRRPGMPRLRTRPPSFDRATTKRRRQGEASTGGRELALRVRRGTMQAERDGHEYVSEVCIYRPDDHARRRDRDRGPVPGSAALHPQRSDDHCAAQRRADRQRDTQSQ